VLEALARALQLDEAERAHLFDLARAANVTVRGARRRPASRRVRPGVQRILDVTAEPTTSLPRRADPRWRARHGGCDRTAERSNLTVTSIT
jgi:hypothetical protein